jgi:hypothetical protein
MSYLLSSKQTKKEGKGKKMSKSSGVHIGTKTILLIVFIAGIILGPTITYLILTSATQMGVDVTQYTCPYDHMTFATQANLDAHLATMHGVNPPPVTTVSVNKKISWCVIDDYAGGGINAVYLYVYDAQLHKYEGDGSAYHTGTDGTLSSGMTYQSGTHLKVKAVTGNSKRWFDVTVPMMTTQDAQSATTNPYTLRFFTVIGTTTAPTLTLIHQGTTISDGGNYNKTLSGNTRTFTFSVICNVDNTGYKESTDPLNNINWYAVVYLKCSGTSYEDISLTGFDGAYEKGTAMYYYKKASADGVNGLTRYKVGNDYVWSGQWGFSFTGDFTGYATNTADWDILVYVYSDPAYYQAKSSYGPDAVLLSSNFDVDIIV